MRIIPTHLSTPDIIRNQQEREWIYNGLDCCVTHEVLGAILPQLEGHNGHTGATYEFSKSLQGPALEMRLRGVLVDAGRKAEVLDEYHNLTDKLERELDRIVFDGVGLINFNWRSSKDLQLLFYEHLGLPIIRKKGSITTDRSAREKMYQYTVARPLVEYINALTDIKKKMEVLTTEIDDDGRIRTSYNIAGTSTGRFSSSFSEFGTGGNLQNIEESLRVILVADPGMKFAKFDAKSGESYCVGAIEWNLFNDGRYLDAIESGDIHTAVARICWPKLRWTGDIKSDKHLAETPYYRHYSYRFMCKKLGHGSNYGGQPETLADQAKLPTSVVIDFQPKYFAAFPAHREWQGWVEGQLRRIGCLVTLTGRKRWFFGRRSDPDTLREAIAYDPQGSLADIVNRAMLRIWRKRTAILVMHDHDALTFMYPEELENEIVPRIHADLVEPIALKNGRTLAIPYDCKVGYNKGEYDAKANPDGLKDFTGEDKRKRSPALGILDRPVRRNY